MKKLLILQNEGKSLGGVWFVNQSIGEELVSLGYEVDIVSIRNSKTPTDLEINKKVTMFTINEKTPWGITRKIEIVNLIKKGQILKALFLYHKRRKEVKELRLDYNKVKKYIQKRDFDYILTTHYQLLDAIPKKYLKRTIHEQHTSLYATKMVKDNMRIFRKYKDKIHFVWLTKNTVKEALEYGFINSRCIYNPVRFSSLKKADIKNNKKLIAITRLSEEKRIDFMIDIVKETFEEIKNEDWIFEIYGQGPLKEQIKQKIKNLKNIKYMGVTNQPQEILFTSSIHLNTSLFEGFSLSIIEASACGVPTLTFYFGESVYEEIDNQKTGIIVPQNEISTYKEELKQLMKDENKLEKMSQASFDFAKQFNRKTIIQEWIKLFQEIDMENHQVLSNNEKIH